MASSKKSPQWHRESLGDATSHALEEARMVLPGIQALFGFQLMVVFSDGFDKKLSTGEQGLHFAALALVAVAVILVNTPAAYHRQADPERTSRRLVDFASHYLTAGMFALAVGTTLDFYLLGVAILGSGPWSAAAATVLFAAFVTFWFAMPRFRPLGN